MSKYYRDAFFDLRTSVNKQVAISYLLGLRSFDPVRQNHNPQGDPHVEQGKYLAGLDRSVFDEISDRRDDALNEVDDAIEEKDQVKKDASRIKVTRCDDLMRLAHRYLCDINYELAKGDRSMLKVDHVATPTPQDPYIEVASLDEWATKKYEINIFKTQPDQLLIGDINEAISADHGETPPEVEEGKVLTDNLYVSFAFLVEAFSKTATGFHDESGPIVIAIAKRIEALAKEAYGGKEFMPSQKHGAIKIKIAEAMKRKKRRLAGK